MSDLKSIHDLFFGVLGKEYCVWYYILMVMTFIGVLISVLGFVTKIATTKKITLSEIVVGVYGVIVFSSMYFTQRMLYSICLR